MAPILPFVQPVARAAEAAAVESSALGSSALESSVEQNWKARNAEDGTNHLLSTGLWTLAVGIAAAAVAALFFGAFTAQGPHSSPGWLCMMLALMSLPFGITVASLGLAKSLRNRHLARAAARP